MSALPGTEYTIDPVSLRATPVDPAAMERCARNLQEQSKQLADPVAGARSASYAALLFVLLGAHRSARQLIEFALVRQAAPERLHDRTVTEIRLAQLEQFAGRFAPAQVLLETLIARCRSDPALESLLDFALQHQGKVLFDLNSLRAALDCFQEALELRRAKRQPELIASTELAIAATKRELHRAGPERAASSTPDP